MNKEEAIDKLNKKYDGFLLSPQPDGPFLEGYISASLTAKDIINKIDEPKKPKVPQVAIEFYECYKDICLDLGEWFGDFYSLQARDEFPKISELAEWLHDNDDETNRLREYALATLVTFGPDAVEVIEEPLGVLLVDMPNNLFRYNLLTKTASGKYKIGQDDSFDYILRNAVKITEAEAKEKYPNFKWVSLEELENES